MELFKLLGKIGIQNAEANDAVNETTEKAEKSQDKITEAFKKIGTAVITYFAADKIISFGKSCIETAASVKASNSQFEQTFKGIETEASNAMKNVADSSGILQTRLQGVGTQIYAFAKSSGADSTEALSLMEEALQAAADGAAYYDKSLEDTSDSLMSFLKGNFANDAALGVSCTETTRNAKATELFGQKYSELSEVQKQQTLLKMVTDAQELSGAMGQASREADGYENVMGNLKEAWKQFQAIIGAPTLELLIPIVQKCTDVIFEMGDKVEKCKKWMEEHKTIMTEVGIVIGTITALILAYNIQQNGATIAATVWSTVSGIATTVTTGLGAAFTFLTSPIGLVILAIGAVIAIGVLLYKNWDTIKEKCSAVANFMGEKFENAKNTVLGIFDKISTGISDKIDKAKEFVSSGIEKIKSFFNFSWELPKLKMPHFKINGSFSINPPSVPSFGIEWYKNGGILNDAGVFGINPKTGSLRVGGEAGPEAVAPISTLQDYIRTVVSEENSGMYYILQRIYDVLVEYFPKFAELMEQDIILDDGTLVGKISPKINEQLEIERKKDERGS